MYSYVVIFEFNERRGDYQPLINKITTLFAHYLPISNSTWFVTSDLSPEDIVTILQQYFYKNDRVIVANTTRKAAWGNLLVDDARWLDTYL